MFDLILKGGTIYDGLESIPKHADIGIIKDKIASIENIIEDECAHQIINVSGAVVSPGFIDLHSHADFALINSPMNQPKVLQGITTEVIGNCGFSPAPTSKETYKLLQKYLFPILGTMKRCLRFETFSDYLSALSLIKTSVNVVSLVGHGTLRVMAMGFKQDVANEHQMKLMKAALLESLNSGAIGLSTGLIYAPACYSNVKELEEFCRILADNDKIFAIHLRNESNMLFESVKESIELAKRTGVHLHISHLKISGEANWNQMDRILDLIDSARQKGAKVTCDQYPYVAGSSTVNVLLPQWALEGGVQEMVKRLKRKDVRERIKKEFETGIEDWDSLVKINGWDNIVLNFINNDFLKKKEGLTLKEISDSFGEDPAEVLFNIITESKGGASIIVFQQSEENLKKIMKKNYVAIGSDGLHTGEKPHPRLYGTFARILDKYVKEQRVLTLAEAIKKMTSLSADIIGLSNRGRIKEGCYADLTVFYPDLVKDTASFSDPTRHPEGIKAVIVNGTPVVLDGRHTGARPGQIIVSAKR